jgi:hypothetical protein
MKKTIFFLITLLIPINFLFSNPIALPQAFISELKFEGNNKWLLEISFRFSTSYLRSQFDSMCVATSNGFSRLRLDNIKDSTNLFVISSDSLYTPLSMNMDGDNIKLYSFISSPIHDRLIDSLKFGNYLGSTIDSLPMGYSITRLSWGIFVKDKNPTIGLPNDTIGTCGTLRGNLFDKNGTRVTRGNFILDNSLVFTDDSMFTTRIFARYFIKYFIWELPSGEYHLIDTLYINMDPDSLLEKNIHFIDYVVGVEKGNMNKIDKLEIVNYPNPFNSSTNFAITIPFSQKYKQKQINIYNVLGQKINSIALSNQSSVQWNGKDYGGKAAATGIYYYRLVLDNRIYKSGSMILLK